MKNNEEKVMDKFEANLSELEELAPIESPSCIIGPWFFVHKKD